jgi:tRNA 2-selenouridine synthase SelU
MKEETEKEIRESRYAEQHLREKYKDEPTKIIELLRAKLKKVEEIFTESAQQESDQPRVESGNWRASLSVPIIHSGTHVGLEICFFSHLTD